VTTSCTHTVRGRAWSMNLGNPVDNAPYRLDRVDLIMLAGSRRQRSCTSWLALRRRDLIVAHQRAGQSTPRPLCGW